MKQSNKIKLKSRVKQISKTASKWFKLFLGKTFSGDDETENYFPFQPIWICFKKIGISNRISSWESQGLWNESIERPTTSNAVFPLIKAGSKIYDFKFHVSNIFR